MNVYEVRKVHSCEFCGTEDETLTTRTTLDDAKTAAEHDAGLALAWEGIADDECPLWADREDGVYRYYIYQQS
ncbi:hypothetical protein ACQP1G_18550 [Nocardia sp. CA-107356]|uniref:hypothetical protein n=1 Tax=Nocardia sp. CA-107356 TaxID=3239972 RepID=UPI003D9380EB